MKYLKTFNESSEDKDVKRKIKEKKREIEKLKIQYQDIDKSKVSAHKSVFKSKLSKLEQELKELNKTNEGFNQFGYMNHLKMNEEGDPVSGLFSIALMWLLIRNMRDSSSSYKRIETPEEKLKKKYLSTEDGDIEKSVPWYKFGKAREEFIEYEKKNRKIFLDEKNRLRKETLEFDAKTLVYEFLKNLPKIGVEDQEKINVLKARMNPKKGYIDTGKYYNLADQMSEIYMKEFMKMFSSKLQELETTRKNMFVDENSYEELLNPRIIYHMSEILPKMLIDTNFDLEKYKPVPPTPIDPDLLKKINEYERKKAEIEQSYKDERERELEEWREGERRKKMPYEEDVKKLNKLVDKYFEKESKKVTDQNKEEIDNIRKRYLSTTNTNKFMELRFRIFRIYWNDFTSKQPENILESFENINSSGVLTLLISALYYKLGIDKDLKTQDKEALAQDLLAFTKYAKTRI